MTDADVIDRFGGTSELARILDVDRRLVHNWRTRGIPQGWRHTLKGIAESRKVTLPKLFLKRRK